ncbi:MAG: FAD-dependent oxidoreductase [Anaerolineae bacterium]|nr:FAD-dependent oxidoreductase [Anaerolineae bacterium]
MTPPDATPLNPAGPAVLEQHVEIAIIGSSLGGCAALEPAAGLEVLLLQETDWIGGQLTAQGVAAPDEHAYIETFGATARYLRLRADLRRSYQDVEGAPAIMAQSVLGPNRPLNPGDGWVSRLCFLPARALPLLEALPGARLRVQRLLAAEMDGPRLVAVTVATPDGRRVRITARYFLDATDTGDLLPLTGTAFVTGAEAQSDTGEPHAAATARPQESQSFTMCFAVEYCPGEDHTIPAPPGYARCRDEQPYTLAPVGRDGQPVIFKMFVNSEQGNLPFWSYRRLHAGALLGGHDIALINWGSNDYYGGDLLTATPAERTRYLDEARRLSLGFLHWLQTECPRDDGGTGYPELKLRPDVMGTADGLSQMPYIRESRRIRARTRIVEQDISTEFQAGARARHYDDSVGVGWYAMDLHACAGNPSVSLYAPTRPFQIPLGALIPQHTDNLIAACKNIGTTHLTGGAYRLHPIEWAIGEAAGALAAFCIAAGVTPAQVHADPWLTWRLQAHLVARGCPLVWAVDVPVAHPAFFATQLLLVRGLIVPGSPRWQTLEIGLHQPCGDSIHLAQLRHLAGELAQRGGTPVDPARLHQDLTWQAVCQLLTPALQILHHRAATPQQKG